MKQESLETLLNREWRCSG